MDYLIFFGLTFLAACIPLIARGGVRSIFTSALIGSTVIFITSLVVAVPALMGSPSVSADGLWYIDPFAALLIIATAFVQLTATMTSVPYLTEELHEEIITVRQIRWYFALLYLFVLSMFVTLLSNNLGLMWVALEATTLTTAFLVAFYTTDGSLEAAWKYILICSVGISLGLLGMLLVFYALSVGGVAESVGVNWLNIRDVAPLLPDSIMKVAFAFILVGFGTKMGLVPMHTWLPDAHARTPSPISGVLSGVLLNAALFAILKYKVLVDGSLGDATWTAGLLIFFGTLTFAVSAAFVLVQENYKRLLAYSSIEHMGFMAFAFGLGPLGAVAGVIHIIGHALSKSLLFYAAGNILIRFQHTIISRTQGVVTVLPYTGAFFLAGILALLAVPPSPLFLSEYFAVAASVVSHPVPTLIILLSGVVIVAGFVRLLVTMLIEEPVDQMPDVGETWNVSHTAMALHVALIVCVGIALMTGDGQHFITHIVTTSL
jgi:hydrogenase-4 component F